MKRSSVAAREENYEHVLMCLICRSLFDDYDHQPKFLPCHHTFCKDCLREYVRQMGDEIECPSCRKIANIPAAGVAALQTNFYVKYIQSLVSGSGGVYCSIKECSKHAKEQPQFYCEQCQVPICKLCCSSDEPKSCLQHRKIPLTTATEESHQNLDSAFSRANATIEAKKVRLETMLKNLSEEKDQSLRKIDSTFEGHVHTLHRRATLLKNKVIDIYKENVEKLENDLLEISTALTCIVSLKDYHESKISLGDFREIKKGIEEIEEVNGNISDRVKPQENHIVFEESHGSDKYKACIKDLGRVRCTRPTIPRTEPEGFDAGAGASGAGLTVPSLADKSPTSEDSKPCTPCEDVKSLASPGEEATGGEHVNACASSVPEAPVGKENDDNANRLLDVQNANRLLDALSNQPEGASDTPPPSPAPPQVSREAYINGTTSPQSKHRDLGPIDTSATPGPDAKSQGCERIPSFVANESQVSTGSCDKTEVPTQVKETSSPQSTATVQEASQTPSHSTKATKTSKLPKVKGGPRTYADSRKAGPAVKDGTKPKEFKAKDNAISKAKDNANSKAKDNANSKAKDNANSKAKECGKGKDGGKKYKGGSKPPSNSVTPILTSPPEPKTQITLLINKATEAAASGSSAAKAPNATVLQPQKFPLCHNGTGCSDVDRLKAEKEYYHMVYTSYDEEELLRELKSGKASLTDDSDNSWLTISSGDESQIGNTLVDEVIVENEQTSF